MNHRPRPPSELQPRVVRFRDAPSYLGMDRNRFNAEVRPFLTEVPIGTQGIGFDRLERPADFHRRLGLHIERVELAGRAEIEDHDHAAFVVILGHRALGFGGHQFGQRKANGPQCAYLEKIATRNPVARVSLASTGHVEHGSRTRLWWVCWGG